MGILSVLMLALVTALDASLNQFRRGADRIESRSGTRSAVRWLERDLRAARGSRPAPYPRLTAGVSEVQREWFESRAFLPFEVDRRSGTGPGVPASFQNAAPEFTSLAFVAMLPSDRALLLGEEGPPALRESLVGYYVAYARDSPLSGEDRAGMKLFRHFRPGGPLYAEGYARGFLLHLSRRINDERDAFPQGDLEALPPLNEAAVRLGRFENADLPFLFSARHPSAESIFTVDGVPAWPRYPMADRLGAPPPDFAPHRGVPADWADPGHPVHDAVFPDEPVAEHVVRFVARPYKRAIVGGKASELDAAALNAHLGLDASEEWPCLVLPDYLEIELSVVDSATARLLPRYEDWIVDWSIDDPARWGLNRERIERGKEEVRFRVPVGPPSFSPLPPP